MKKSILLTPFFMMVIGNLAAQTFQLVQDINPGTASGTPSELVEFGDAVIFKATSLLTTRIYRSDGTDIGTYQLSEIYPSELDQTKIVKSGNLVYFTLVSNNVVSLWSTNGTPQGTAMVKDSIGLDQNVQMIDNNDILFFLQHNTDSSGDPVTQLWKSDGTTGGTVIVKEWAMNLNATLGFAHNGIVYLSTTNVNEGLYISDGTLAGTLEIDNSINSINYPKVYNDLVYFSWGDGIFVSDGTEAGTTYLSNVVTSTNTDFVMYNNQFYITSGIQGSGNGQELYVTNGTQTPTLLKDINLGAESSNITDFVLAPDGFYFYADDGNHGMELWKSDGTTAGTHMVRDINPETTNDATYYPKKIMYNNRLFFIANDGESGAELWSTNGTEEDTYLHQDINDAGVNGSACLDEMTVLNNQILFFAGCTDGTGNELWSSGTLGLNELIDNEQLLIVPNPANEVIQLKSDLLISYYKIIDLNGRVIAQGNFDNSLLIDTLESGSYLIQAVLSNGTIATQRLIKQ